MASFSTTKQSVLDRINTLASNAATTAEESIYLSKALREAAFDQRFVWRGAWTQGLVYVAGDVAQYDGNAFVCTVVHTASSVFASDSAKWDTMVVGGAQWTTGSSVPANSVGEDGDWFYNTADETIHNKQGGSWTSIADLGGSRWTSSATVPANSAGEIGDFHMDTATQKIHEKTGATAWTELADLTPNADWNATSGNNGFISNKPSFKTVGGSSIIGSGDITVADTQDLSGSNNTLSLTNSPDVTFKTLGGSSIIGSGDIALPGGSKGIFRGWDAAANFNLASWEGVRWNRTGGSDYINSTYATKVGNDYRIRLTYAGEYLFHCRWMTTADNDNWYTHAQHTINGTQWSNSWHGHAYNNDARWTEHTYGVMRYSTTATNQEIGFNIYVNGSGGTAQVWHSGHEYSAFEIIYLGDV